MDSARREHAVHHQCKIMRKPDDRRNFTYKGYKGEQCEALKQFVPEKNHERRRLPSFDKKKKRRHSQQVVMGQ